MGDGRRWARNPGHYTFACITYKHNRKPKTTDRRSTKYMCYRIRPRGVQPSRSPKFVPSRVMVVSFVLIKQTTVVKRLSFNVSFRAWDPPCSGLIFWICSSHSLPHAFVEIGLFALNLSASAKVYSKKGLNTGQRESMGLEGAVGSWQVRTPI